MDNRTTNQTPPSPIHFLAFLRELIIRIGGNFEKGRKIAPLKLGSLLAVSRKIQSHTSLHQSSQAWPVIVFQLLSVTAKIQTFSHPFFSAVPALIKLSANLHHQDTTIIHCNWPSNGDSTAPGSGCGLLVSFFLFFCRSSLYIWDASPLSNIWFAIFFSIP